MAIKKAFPEKRVILPKRVVIVVPGIIPVANSALDRFLPKLERGMVRLLATWAAMTSRMIALQMRKSRVSHFHMYQAFLQASRSINVSDAENRANRRLGGFGRAKKELPLKYGQFKAYSGIGSKSGLPKSVGGRGSIPKFGLLGLAEKILASGLISGASGPEEPITVGFPDMPFLDKITRMKGSRWVNAHGYWFIQEFGRGDQYELGGKWYHPLRLLDLPRSAYHSTADRGKIIKRFRTRRDTGRVWRGKHLRNAQEQRKYPGSQITRFTRKGKPQMYQEWYIRSEGGDVLPSRSIRRGLFLARGAILALYGPAIRKLLKDIQKGSGRA